MALWLLIGAGIFYGGEQIIEKRFGEQAGTLGIVLGSIIDGVPSSAIFGIQLALTATVNPAFLTAVTVSNIPQSLAPSSDLAESGWKMLKVARMWAIVVILSGLTGAFFYWFASSFAGVTGDRVSGLAAGGILAMLTNSLIPFAYERGGKFTGIFTVIGFATSTVMAFP